MSSGYLLAIPTPGVTPGDGEGVGVAGAVVGIALEVRKITAENDTNLVRRITAKPHDAFVQLKARHRTLQQQRK